MGAQGVADVSRHRELRAGIKDIEQRLEATLAKARLLAEEQVTICAVHPTARAPRLQVRCPRCDRNPAPSQDSEGEKGAMLSRLRSHQEVHPAHPARSSS